ncbi:hypothetical protein DFH29DRAFT_1002078 [Suillus ampliporus]|nr:hypothetical protein DFH29DRAFT_1002078 [Suillus ampliporus]
MPECADKENMYSPTSSNKRLRSPSPETAGETRVKRPKRELHRRIPLEVIQQRLQNSTPGQFPLLFSDFAAADMIPSPQTPVPSPIPLKPPVQPYRQTPAPLIVSQNYMRRLVTEHWDAELRRCEEARKAQMLEVQLAAHGITKLV